MNKLAAASHVYELVFRCTDPNDSQTVLNKLAETYRSHLEREHSEVVDDYRFRLHLGARYGEQVWPILPMISAVFLLPTIAVVAIAWFLINPFRFAPPGFSIMDPVIWLVATSLFAAILMGLVLATSQPKYESTATVQINDSILEQSSKGSAENLRLAVLNNAPHSILIRQCEHIDQVLSRNNLYVLDSFEDLAKHDCIDHVQQAMKIEPDPESPNTLKIRYRTYNELDSMTVLNNLIKGYSVQLKKEHQRITERRKARSPADHGIPVEYTVDVIESAAEGEPVGFEFENLMRLTIGIFASVLGTFVWLTYRATMTKPEEMIMAEIAE